jgi:hypothetical protein
MGHLNTTNVVSAQCSLSSCKSQSTNSITKESNVPVVITETSVMTTVGPRQGPNNGRPKAAGIEPLLLLHHASPLLHGKVEHHVTLRPRAPSHDNTLKVNLRVSLHVPMFLVVSCKLGPDRCNKSGHM